MHERLFLQGTKTKTITACPDRVNFDLSVDERLPYSMQLYGRSVGEQLSNSCIAHLFLCWYRPWSSNLLSEGVMWVLPFIILVRWVMWSSFSHSCVDTNSKATQCNVSLMSVQPHQCTGDNIAVVLQLGWWVKSLLLLSTLRKLIHYDDGRSFMCVGHSYEGAHGKISCIEFIPAVNGAVSHGIDGNEPRLVWPALSLFTARFTGL